MHDNSFWATFTALVRLDLFRALRHHFCLRLPEAYRDRGPLGVYSRNLTPDKTGLPEVAIPFENFLKFATRQRLRPCSPELYRPQHSPQLLHASLQWRSIAGDALADLQEHD
jgi:hypothetical protein